MRVFTYNQGLPLAPTCSKAWWGPTKKSLLNMTYSYFKPKHLDALYTYNNTNSDNTPVTASAISDRDLPDVELYDTSPGQNP